jgi:hypothetical protein
MIPTMAGVSGGTPLFNVATGGTVTTATISGLNYRFHTFEAAGTATFTVQANPRIFRILTVGGGRGGEADGGGGGAIVDTDNVILAVGSYTVTVGAGGAGSTPGVNATSGGNSSLGSAQTANGATGRLGASPGGGNGGASRDASGETNALGNPGGNGGSSSISGVKVAALPGLAWMAVTQLFTGLVAVVLKATLVRVVPVTVALSLFDTRFLKTRNDSVWRTR